MNNKMTQFFFFFSNVKLREVCPLHPGTEVDSCQAICLFSKHTVRLRITSQHNNWLGIPLTTEFIFCQYSGGSFHLCPVVGLLSLQSGQNKSQQHRTSGPTPIIPLSSSPGKFSWFSGPALLLTTSSVSLLFQIEADDWGPLAPLRLLYLRHCLITMHYRQASLDALS